MSIKDFLKPAPYINNTNPINPSDRAKNDYDVELSKLTNDRFNLLRLVAILAFVIVIMTISLIYFATKSEIKPYIVEVDTQTGIVRNAGYLQEQKYEPQEVAKKYFITDFIKKMREIPLDPVLYKRNINSSYAFLSRDAMGKLNHYLQVLQAHHVIQPTLYLVSLQKRLQVKLVYYNPLHVLQTHFLIEYLACP